MTIHVRNAHYARIYGQTIRLVAGSTARGPLGSTVTVFTVETSRGIVEWGGGFIASICGRRGAR